MGLKPSAPATAALLLTLALPGAASAQTADGRNGVDELRPPALATADLDVNRLPVNLQRIQRELQQSRERTDHEGLNLRYIVDVFGRAPTITFFRPDENLRTGPVPQSAPSHQDMLNQMTPREYRSPAADFGALFRWLGDRR
jgi:hypothetical protein